MTLRSQSYRPDGTSPPESEIILPKKRRWKIRPEDGLQIACVSLLRYRHIPYIIAQPERLNAAPQRRDWFKKLGILGNAGHVELLVFLESGLLCCELKSKDGRLSADQIKWRDMCMARGYRWGAPRTVEEFAALLG